jgi:hypothetical protein
MRKVLPFENRVRAQASPEPAPNGAGFQGGKEGKP